MKLEKISVITKNIFAVFALIIFVVFQSLTPAHALEPVDVTAEQAAIDLTRSYELHQGAGSKIQIKTAPDADGVINRIEVRSSAGNSSGNWLAFALANNSEKQIDRLIVAPPLPACWIGLIMARSR